MPAGFDAAIGDELGGCFVSPACYSQMTAMLMTLANGKVAICLEGGYNLHSISCSALAVAKTLMGEPPERLVIPAINHEAMNCIENVKRIQSDYWECLRDGVLPIAQLQGRGGDRLSKVMQSGWCNELREKFNMMSMHIQMSGLSEHFEKQVMVTPFITHADRIVMIIHDP